MRKIAILLAVVVFGLGFFVAYTYYESRTLFLRRDPSLAYTEYVNLLQVFTLLGVVVTFFAALFVYLLFTIKTTAQRLAYGMSKDIAFSRDRLRKFYELSPVPYLVVDKNGVIIRPNKASLRFFGMNEEQLLGKTLFSYFSLPEHQEKLLRYEEEIKRAISIEQKEVQVHAMQGAVRWALFSAEPLGDSRAGNSEVLVTLVDIHEQKELERIKTEFLSLASHQLRAPLANLKWYIDFLLKRRKDSLTPEIASYLEKMFRRNEEMIDLVNTLLNLSRVEMGRVKVEKQDGDVAQLARGVVEELETAGREKDILVRVDAPDTLPLNTDHRLVRIVLQNLLTNAIRYTPQGGSVTVQVRQSSGGVEVAVTDTGVGIPPEEQSRIFSKMYRATNAQAMEVNGNGIGLYMCKALVEAMGGEIGFQSTLGQGTVFRMVLR